MKKSQFKLPFKHYVNRYNALDVCAFHRGTDNLQKALQWYAQEVEHGSAGDKVTLWKGRARTKPFAETVIPATGCRICGHAATCHDCQRIVM